MIGGEILFRSAFSPHHTLHVYCPPCICPYACTASKQQTALMARGQWYGYDMQVHSWQTYRENVPAYGDA